MPNDPKASAILLIACPDRSGIVAAVSGFIAENGGNILDSDQHTDLVAGQFYMRIEWELAKFSIPRAELADALTQKLADPFGMKWRLHFSDEVRRAAVFVSKQDHCFWDVLLRQRAGELNMEIPLVISNHEDQRPVADYFGIPFHHVPVSADGREEAEQRQVELLEEYGVDLVILARYMQILSPGFVANWRGRAINVHHSFLPAFTGARPYHQAHERGVKLIGATSHYVTEELDEGPIITQAVARSSHRDSVDDLVRKGKDLEKVVLAEALRVHLANRVLIVGNKTVVFD